ncbi:type I-E CRISPR-associated protein Cas6/Cse3/CasE [Tropicimonas sp. IMCC34043]|uniref:type I-E CRISPR-associated protein Cas6/Cse3/CasE n=1 Tax=Tropicimonas sp. IMCC34043 TaxID=2248760 RepID=UPI000E26509F|nr:type I-E CRISPR-associated protein Cas6/Cse3/CasE [Tropicimonas sp. IMCC34043]
MSLYLSRLSISRDPAVSTLDALLEPRERGRRSDAHHRLLWTAFAGDPEAKRDFLWRGEGKGRFLTLSARHPGDSPFFDPPEVKAFAPDLARGDQLFFTLRANATRTERTGEMSGGGKERKRHIDLVMDALYPLKEGRAEARMQAAQSAGQGWLAGQGARNGFVLDEVTVGDYSVHALPAHSGRRKGQPQFGILDLTGKLTVTDPAAFLARLAAGFGRAKAFGCGLMLIRRAR